MDGAILEKAAAQLAELRAAVERIGELHRDMQELFGAGPMGLYDILSELGTQADIELGTQADIELGKQADIELGTQADIELGTQADIEPMQRG